MKDNHRKKLHEMIDEAVDGLKPVVKNVADKGIDLTEEFIDDIMTNLFTKPKNKKLEFIKRKGDVHAAKENNTNS